MGPSGGCGEDAACGGTPPAAACPGTILPCSLMKRKRESCAGVSAMKFSRRF